MPISRRDFFKGAMYAASGVALSQLGCVARAQSLAARRPTKFIQVFFRGGIDALLTTDPKLRSEAVPKITSVYEEHEITKIDTGARIGPLLSGLGSQHLSRAAILNGVIGGTVAHQIGTDQTAQLRRVYPRWSGWAGVGERVKGSSVGIGGTIAEAVRERTPLAEVWMLARAGGTPSWLPAGRSLVVTEWSEPEDTTLSKLVRLGIDEPKRAVIIDVLEKQARAGGADPDVRVKALHELVGKLPRKPLPEAAKLQAPKLPDGLGFNFVGANLKTWGPIVRDAMVMLSHGLTTSIYMLPDFSGFDTHQSNLEGQTQCMLLAVAELRHLFDELARWKTPDGTPLAEQTVVFVSSEIGRHPFTNEVKGKDHFPEMPVLVWGPGVRPGQYGETDKQMIAQPISAQTGHPARSKKDFVPTIDDVGASLLRWFGADDTVALGYPGRHLDFLFRA